MPADKTCYLCNKYPGSRWVGKRYAAQVCVVCNPLLDRPIVINRASLPPAEPAGALVYMTRGEA